MHFILCIQTDLMNNEKFKMHYAVRWFCFTVWQLNMLDVHVPHIGTADKLETIMIS
jgi:hypothetical protein